MIERLLFYVCACIFALIEIDVELFVELFIKINK